MLISTRGRYALRVMVDLAEHSNGNYIAMKEVAARQDISLKYLERILPLLVKEKLIEGVHGKGGGYRLTRKPSEYTVGEILRLTEGDLAPVSCLDCRGVDCDRRESCRTLPMWEKLDKIVNEYFDGITILDLMYKDIASDI
ncbi:MAG: RrF2 family transcriptional regulator [Lachnospiraceae bacterium]|nr:RrF2 family transcriptional regulator [Lachnospiraceae bacterium]